MKSRRTSFVVNFVVNFVDKVYDKVYDKDSQSRAHHLLCQRKNWTRASSPVVKRVSFRPAHFTCCAKDEIDPGVLDRSEKGVVSTCIFSTSSAFYFRSPFLISLPITWTFCRSVSAQVLPIRLTLTATLTVDGKMIHPRNP